MALVTRVVVADPDEDTRNLVHLTFASEQWSVGEAVDAAATIRLVATGVPEVLVVDANLPGGGGGATARVLRSQPRTAGIGIIVLTGGGDAAPDDGTAEDHADAVLERPFDGFALLAAVEQALGRDGRA